MSGSSGNQLKGLQRSATTHMGVANLDRAAISQAIMPELGALAEHYGITKVDMAAAAQLNSDVGGMQLDQS